MIAIVLRAIADVLDPQRGLPPSQAAYVADLNEARAEGRRDALRELSEWLTPLAAEANARAQQGARLGWDSRYHAFRSVIAYCRQMSL
jgi:hypothetical protein